MSAKLVAPAKPAALSHFNTSQGSLFPISAPDSIRRLPDGRVAIAGANGQIVDWLEGASPSAVDMFVEIYTNLILTRRLTDLIDWSFLNENNA